MNDFAEVELRFTFRLVMSEKHAQFKYRIELCQPYKLHRTLGVFDGAEPE